jgi:hypothetical protein
VLRAHGYWVHGWRLGRNTQSLDLLDAVRARLVEVHGRHGDNAQEEDRQPVPVPVPVTAPMAS